MVSVYDNDMKQVINPRRACAARITVSVLREYGVSSWLGKSKMSESWGYVISGIVQLAFSPSPPFLTRLPAAVAAGGRPPPPHDNGQLV